MNSNTSVSISILGCSSLEDNVADLHDRIARRAYAKFLGRDGVSGYELEDWLAAEAEMLISPRTELRVENSQLIAEIIVPDIDPGILFVSVTPQGLIVFSEPDDSGRQVFRAINFPRDVETASVEAEYVLDTLFVVAAIAHETGSAMETEWVA
jgi:hypothetical protein